MLDVDGLLDYDQLFRLRPPSNGYGKADHDRAYGIVIVKQCELLCHDVVTCVLVSNCHSSSHPQHQAQSGLIATRSAGLPGVFRMSSIGSFYTIDPSPYMQGWHSSGIRDEAKDGEWGKWLD